MTKHPVSKIAYHYCSPVAFESIVCNGEFRASRIDQMNDPEELNGGLDILFKRLLQRFPSQKRMIEKWRGFIKHDQFYCASFSLNDDLLSQWRAYAANGAGFAIGFDVNELEALDSGSITQAISGKRTIARRPGNVISSDLVTYSDADFNQLLITFLDENDIVDELPKLIGEHYDSSLDSYKLKQISLLAALYKNAFYSEEQELRLTKFLNDNTRQRLERKIGFSSTNRGLKSYYVFGLRSKSAHCLREVILGPTNNSSVDDVAAFLELNGYFDVNIRRSEGKYSG